MPSNSSDAYDRLLDRALLDGVRIAPLFRVMVNLPGEDEAWQVCMTSLEGDPVGRVATYRELEDAIEEAKRLNAFYGSKSKLATASNPYTALLADIQLATEEVERGLGAIRELRRAIAELEREK
jgi:hypothetical protein